MKRFKLISICFLLLFSTLIANKIAVATKINGLVEIMLVDTKDFSKLKPGTVL